MPTDPVLQWCSDALHDVLGFSDAALASFLVAVARRKRSSPSSIMTELQNGGVNAPKSTLDSFCRQLYAKCKPNEGNESINEIKKETNADWVEKAKAYELIEEEEEDDDDEEHRQLKRARRKEKKAMKKASSKVGKAKDEKPSRKRQRRRYELSSDDDNDESAVRHPEHRRSMDEDENEDKEDYNDGNKQQDGTVKPQSSLTEKERAELEREQDLKERDEFIERMLKRDEEKTNKKQQEKREQYEAQVDIERRLARGETATDPQTGEVITLEKLQERSRREYLKKRTERQIELKQRELEDEEEMFYGQELTNREKRRLEMDKKILKMAKGQEEEEEEDLNDGFYRLPDEYNEKQSKASQDQALLTSRYRDEKGEKTEQELWEESQTLKAAGVGLKKKRNKSPEKEYDLVFDDQIDFVMQTTRKGYDRRDKKQKDKEEEEQKSKNVLEQQPLTAHQKILAGRKKLPVFPYREEFLAAVKDHQVLILVGETGSGKTTQIPQYLHEIGYSELGKIGCTQPRRVAAMSVAARVATEMNVRIGHEVGYSIRFENCTSQRTIIQYMTDGMLLREILTEPDLASYSCLVIDEAHERTLHTDILFGLVKDIVRFRKDLKLIISSATLDAEKFSKYFDDASVFMIPGRMFPVDIYYTKAPEADYVDAAVVTVLQIHVSQKIGGDILVFLTGQEEIEAAAEILTQRTRNLGNRIPELIICPIYANLPSDQQSKIFDATPKGARKVVLATNIAETSLTISGICYVIDSGFSKQNSYNARTGMESLVVTPISQAAANQRAGRAGRTQAGKCFRLYTAWSFQKELDPNTTPEILRTNMGNVVLMLKSMGINDLMNFDFMDRPPPEALIRALEQLYALGALNDRGELTKLGRRMAEFPLDPMLSKAIIASEKYKCTSEVLSSVAMLSLGASVFYRPKEKAVHADTARLNFARGGGGDHIALMRCYNEWASTDFSTQWCFENFVQVRSMRKARDIREQLEGLCERVEIDQTVSEPEDIDAPLKAITSGFFYNIAKLGRSGDFQTVKQPKTVYIHPSSVLAKEDEPPPWVVFFELAFTTKEFMRQVAPIKPEWLIEIAPHFYQESDVEDPRSKKMPKSRGRR